jgi:uncharacterized protein (TIGR00290 family)
LKHALFWSGGKDSLLALDRATRAGLEVSHLVNISEGNTGRVRFHGVRKELIRAQANALDKRLLQFETHPDSFEQAFARALGQARLLGVGAIAFGNIHLADVRAWYEERTTAAGFRHVEPIWGEPPGKLVREFVERGHRSRIVSVYLEAGGKPEWLGRDITTDFIEEVERAGADPAGECGEYHSFAYGGPLFRDELRIRADERFERERHLILDVAITPEIA